MKSTTHWVATATRSVVVKSVVALGSALAFVGALEPIPAGAGVGAVSLAVSAPAVEINSVVTATICTAGIAVGSVVNLQQAFGTGAVYRTINASPTRTATGCRNVGLTEKERGKATYRVQVVLRGRTVLQTTSKTVKVYAPIAVTTFMSQVMNERCSGCTVQTAGHTYEYLADYRAFGTWGPFSTSRTAIALTTCRWVDLIVVGSTGSPNYPGTSTVIFEVTQNSLNAQSFSFPSETVQHIRIQLDGSRSTWQTSFSGNSTKDLYYLPGTTADCLTTSGT